MAEALTFHCPRCGESVSASSEAEAVACPRCFTAFSPWGTPTVARSSTPVPAAVPATPDDPLVGTRIGGRRLVRVIGRGGMGAVYEAEDPVRGRVAVKVLPPTLAADSSFVSRFRREAKTLSSLSHPHLVEVFEQGEEDGRFWFAMEHVAGDNLRRRLERGPLPWREAVRVAQEVLLGLGYAHGRGVAHRDLKPENVLLSEDGRVRLVDFGLSRILRGESAEDTARLTRTNVILGTYEYMAPEQRLGSLEVDERADLYALGVILYETLTGSLPLGRFPSPSEARPGCPATLDAVVHRVLAPAPKDRFPSAAAFREALAEATAAAGATPAPTPPTRAVPDARVAAARSVLRHVEILSALDRVFGALFLIVGVGIWARTLRPIFSLSLLNGIPSVVLIVAGALLLKQGARLARMAPGSREAQVTASMFLLVVVPPLGVYGLIVMTTDRARDAFAMGRARLLAPPASPPPPPPPPPPSAPAEVPSRRERRVRHGLFFPRALLTFGIGIAAMVLCPSLRDPDHPEVMFLIFGSAFVVAATWARFGHVGWVRGLVYAAILFGIGAIVWDVLIVQLDVDRPAFEWPRHGPPFRKRPM